MKLNKNLYLFIPIVFIVYQFIDKMIWYQPNYSSDYDTHWAYLAATTFDFIDDKWDFPKWVYGPWYYFFCSYLFGPFYFTLYKLDIITIHTAANYTFLSGNFSLQLILIFGTLKLAKLLFKNSFSRVIFLYLIIFLPFTHKSFYNYGVENLGIALMPWLLYYLNKLNYDFKIKNIIKFSIIFSIFASSKANLFFPIVLFYSLFIFLKIVNKNFNLKLFFPFILLFFTIILSNKITNHSIFKNSDIGNEVRGYGDTPNVSIFYNVNIKNAYQKPLKYDQSNSMLNAWLLDFFGDYYGNFKSEIKNQNKNLTILANRISIFCTLLFFIFYLSSFITVLIKQNKFITLNNLYLFFFFAIFFEAIAYCYFVFMADKANSLNLRYWGFYIFFLVFPIAKCIEFIKRKWINKIFKYLCYFFVLISIIEMYVIL